MMNVRYFILKFIVYSFLLLLMDFKIKGIVEKKMPLKVPSIVDGTPLGINGHEVKKILYVLRRLERMVHGSIDKETEIRNGYYSFQNQSYTLKDLVMLEKKGTLDESFTDLFKKSLDEFLTFVEPYMDQIQAGRLITFKLINEWVTYHNREDSILPDWTCEKSGHEVEFFKKEVTSFEKFYLFCVDLASFLTDLLKSCPRSWQQFLDLQEKKDPSLV